MVPKQTRQGEESCQQVENHQLVSPPSVFFTDNMRGIYTYPADTHSHTVGLLTESFGFFFCLKSCQVTSQSFWNKIPVSMLNISCHLYNRKTAKCKIQTPAVACGFFLPIIITVIIVVIVLVFFFFRSQRRNKN